MCGIPNKGNRHMNIQPTEAAEPKSAASADTIPWQRILLVGPTGAGKSTQIWTLPGKKFAYVFDPNTIPAIIGCPDLYYAEFLPEFTEMDATLKGFNKGARSDKPASIKEPTLYLRWIKHLNDFVATERYKAYDWLIFDSLTFLAKAVMDRQLYINNRYGDIEDLGDYRIVGSKISDVFGSIAGLDINILSTGHIASFQDEKTKKIITQLFLPGKARNMLPLSHTNIWLAMSEEGEKGQEYKIRTVPQSKGLQEIRSSIRGLKPVEDVTIKDFNNAGQYGIGALIQRSTKNAVHKRSA
jgi:GTPase SAR1 family protein